MEKLFGTYEIEKAKDEKKEGFAYLLHGPKVTYTLVRVRDGQSMYPLNSRLNTCSIKGNYWFSDKTGELRAMS